MLLALNVEFLTYACQFNLTKKYLYTLKALLFTQIIKNNIIYQTMESFTLTNVVRFQHLNEEKIKLLQPIILNSERPFPH